MHSGQLVHPWLWEKCWSLPLPWRGQFIQQHWCSKIDDGALNDLMEGIKPMVLGQQYLFTHFRSLALENFNCMLKKHVFRTFRQLPLPLTCRWCILANGMSEFLLAGILPTLEMPKLVAVFPLMIWMIHLNPWI